MECASTERCENNHCVARRCGDGQIDPGETCDAGGANKSPGTPGASCACSQDDPACTRSFNVSWANSCLWARCGDGVVNNLAVFQGRTVNYELLQEQCDDGDANGTPGNPCSAQCQLLLAQGTSMFCGNGRLDAGEECDEGILNNDNDANRCRSLCRLPYCGDGVIDNGERCDAGRLNGQEGGFCDNVCGRGQMAAGQFEGQTITLSLLPAEYMFPGQGQNGTTFDSSLTTIATSRPPAGDTGPAAVGVMAMGAAAGWAWIRRRKEKTA